MMTELSHYLDFYTTYNVLGQTGLWKYTFVCWLGTRSWKSNQLRKYYFFIPLLSSSESRPVIITKTQKVVVRNQSLYRISYNIDVYRFLFNTKSGREKQTIWEIKVSYTISKGIKFQENCTHFVTENLSRMNSQKHTTFFKKYIYQLPWLQLFPQGRSPILILMGSTLWILNMLA